MATAWPIRPTADYTWGPPHHSRRHSVRIMAAAALRRLGHVGVTAAPRVGPVVLPQKKFVVESWDVIGTDPDFEAANPHNR